MFQRIAVAGAIFTCVIAACLYAGFPQIIETATPDKIDESPDPHTIEYPASTQDSVSAPSTQPRTQKPEMAGFDDEYSRLRADAEAGSADAAYELLSTIRECNALPRSSEDLATEQRRIVSSISDATNKEELHLLEHMARELPEKHSRCTEFGWRDNAERAYWARMAAELGHSRAQLEFVAEQLFYLEESGEIIRDSLAVEQWKADSQRILLSALRAGETDAAYQIGHAYKEGTVFERDLSRAYAYFYVSARVHPGAFDHLLDEIGGQLPAAQLEQARNRGEQLYLGCCVNSFRPNQ